MDTSAGMQALQELQDKGDQVATAINAEVGETDQSVEDTKTTAEQELSQINVDVQDTNDGIQITNRAARTLVSASFGIVNDILQMYGITLGVGEKIVEYSVQMALSLVAMATATSAATFGAGAMSLIATAAALNSVLDAQGKQSDASAAMTAAKDAISITRVISSL